MIRRPPRSTLSSSSAASDVYKRQAQLAGHVGRVFGCGPAGAGYVTGVVKVDDLLEALEVAVVAVCLHETGARPRVNVAQCRHLEFAEFRGVDRHVVAGALEVPAETQAD